MAEILYVIDGGSELWRINPTTPNDETGDYGLVGALPSGLPYGTGVTALSNGDLIVIGPNLWRINPNNPSSEIGDYGLVGEFPSSFGDAGGITVLSNDDLMVVDFGATIDRLWRIDPTNPSNQAGDYGLVGAFPSGLQNPQGIAVLSNGDFMVADNIGNELWRINPVAPNDEAGDYGFLGAFPSGVGNARGMAVLANGDLMVLEASGSELWRINPTTPNDETGDYGLVGDFPSGLGSAQGSFAVALISTPDAPTAPTLTVNSQTQITAVGIAPDDGGATISSYDWRHKKTADAGWTDRLDETNLTQVFSGLDVGTEYEVQFRATNSEGDSAYSPSAIATTNAATVPARPTAPTLTVDSDTEITAAYTAPDNGGSPITGYRIRHSVSGANSWTTNTDTASPYQITGLTGNTEYEVQVAAVNGVGDSPWSPSATATTIALTIPSFSDDTGNAQSWTQDSAITPITVPQATGNPVPSYAAVGSLPTGISFNTGTRVISGTPTAIASGTIRIRATNSQGSDDWTVAYATAAGVPTTSVTVPLTGIGLFTNYIRWSDNQSLGAVFDADGVGQTLTYAELNDASPTGRVGISIIGTNNRFTTAFEATGRIIFEASDGTTLEVVIADADTSEPYNWVPSNALEVATFVGHIRGLTDQDGTLTLIGATPTVTVPAFADNTGDAQSWTRNAAITNITVPAATGTPAPTYTAVGSLPAGIAFNTTTRAISGTPTAVGSGTITIRATNSEGSDDWTVTYAVAAALTVPVFSDDTGIAQNWTLGTAIATVTVPTADGNPTPSYAAVGALPAGINFNTGNRQLTGTPTAAGSGTIRIRATNSQGSDDWTVTYTTSAALTPPLFTDDTGVAQAWTQNVAIPTLTVPAASGNPTPSYAVVGGLPTGISFNTGNRRINGTPTAIGSGTIRIRATNSQGSDDWTVTYATAGPTITTDTDAVYMLAATTPTTPTGGTTSLNHTPAGWQRTAPSATTTQAVYRIQRTRTYTDGAFTSATTWGTPSIFANRLLTLAEYDTTGLEVDAAALFVAAAPTDIYADANRGGTQTPEDGELGIGAGQTLITRIRVRDNGDRIGLNDNDVPTALDMSTHFGAGGTTSAWTLTIQTAAWAVSSNQVGTSAGNFINWTFGADDAALLDGIGAGERVIIAIARTASVTPTDVVLSAQGLGIALAIGQPTLVIGSTPSEVVLSAQVLGLALAIGQPTLVVGAAPAEVVLSAQGLSLALSVGQPTTGSWSGYRPR